MCMPTGLTPLPFDLWLHWPDEGCVDPYRIGVVRDYISRVREPGDWSEDQSVRLAYPGAEEIFELLLRDWAHLRYLHWYCKVSTEYSTSCWDLWKVPPVCYSFSRFHSPKEQLEERSQWFTYGSAFKCWELYRKCRVPRALVSLEDEGRRAQGRWSSCKRSVNLPIYKTLGVGKECLFECGLEDAYTHSACSKVNESRTNIGQGRKGKD